MPCTTRSSAATCVFVCREQQQRVKDAAEPDAAARCAQARVAERLQVRAGRSFSSALLCATVRTDADVRSQCPWAGVPLGTPRVSARWCPRPLGAQVRWCPDLQFRRIRVRTAAPHAAQRGGFVIAAGSARSLALPAKPAKVRQARVGSRGNGLRARAHRHRDETDIGALLRAGRRIAQQRGAARRGGAGRQHDGQARRAHEHLEQRVRHQGHDHRCVPQLHRCWDLACGLAQLHLIEPHACPRAAARNSLKRADRCSRGCQFRGGGILGPSQGWMSHPAAELSARQRITAWDGGRRACATQVATATAAGPRLCTSRRAATRSSSWTTCAAASSTCSWVSTRSRPSPPSTTASAGAPNSTGVTQGGEGP